MLITFPLVEEEYGEMMPRPQKIRFVGFNPQFSYFGPRGASPGQILLGVDELEALRLYDLEGMSQEDAAKRMNVSRATFGRIIERARWKVSNALIYGKGISIGGGDVMFRPPTGGRRFAGGPHGPHGHGKGPWK